MSVEHRDAPSTGEQRGELFGVHVPELQLALDEYRAGLRAAGLSEDDAYLKLGSGHGGGLMVAASEFGARATGVEYLEDAIERATRAAQKAGVADRITIVRDDLRRVDPTPFDVVHMHLGPAFHDVLASRMERLLTQHARVVAAGWRVPGWQPLPDALEQWDGGYVYRPADPRMQASWGERVEGDPDYVELHVHADLWDLEPRLDGAPAADRIALDRTDHAARGTIVLVQAPPAGTQLEIWARCRAGRLTQRGPIA